MSFLTGTGAELIYVNNASGTAKNTFTAEALVNDTAGAGPQPFLPQGFFAGSSRKALKLVVRGIIGATSAAPTWQILIRAGANGNITGPILGESDTFTGLASTSILFELEEDITIGDSAGYTIGTGATTVRGQGTLRCPKGASPFGAQVFAGSGGQPGSITNFDPSIGNYLNVSAVCGTSNAANQIQITQFLVFGLN